MSELRNTPLPSEGPSPVESPLSETYEPFNPVGDLVKQIMVRLKIEPGPQLELPLEGGRNGS